MKTFYFAVCLLFICRTQPEAIHAQGGNVVAGNLILSGKSITFLSTDSAQSGILSDKTIISQKAIVQFVDTSLKNAMSTMSGGMSGTYYTKSQTDSNITSRGFISSETDPTVPSYVKSIQQSDINNWNYIYNNALIGITSTQVTNALGYVPVNPSGTASQYIKGDGTKATFPTIPTNTNQLTNGSGYITGINSSQVTTALGYTPTNPNGLTSQYVKGDGSFGTLNTTGVPEGANLYYTDGRSRSAIILTSMNGMPSFNTGTGVLNIPPQIDTTSLSNRVNGKLSTGTTTSSISEGSNLYYTNTRARASLTLSTSSATPSFDYSTGIINVPPPIDTTSIINKINNKLSTGTTTSSISEGSNLYYTDGRARASITLITSNVVPSFNSVTGVLNVPPVLDSSSLSNRINNKLSIGTTTTSIVEGTNLYHTDARSRASISGTTGSVNAYNSATGVITFGPSVNTSSIHDTVTRSLNTTYTISTIGAAFFTYPITITDTISLVSTSAIGIVTPQYSLNSGTTWVSMAPISFNPVIGVTGLASLSFVQVQQYQLQGWVPANALVKLVTSVTGKCGISIGKGQEYY